jgi:hypothetical protein
MDMQQMLELLLAKQKKAKTSRESDREQKLEVMKSNQAKAVKQEEIRPRILNLEEMESITEHQEFPNEEAAVKSWARTQRDKICNSQCGSMLLDAASVIRNCNVIWFWTSSIHLPNVAKE